MDSESRQKIEETVLEILRKSNLEEMTEFKVRQATSEQLGIDLSDVEHKGFVRSVVESFLISASELETNAREELTEANAQEEQGARLRKEVSEDGSRLICKLSDRRNVVISNFKEKTYVSIREFYQKDGKQLPTPKGISLPSEQWATFKNSVPAIVEAINKLQSRLRSELETKQTEDGKQTEEMSNSFDGLVGKQTEEMSNSSNGLAGKQTEEMCNLFNGLAPQELVAFETSRLNGKNYPFWVQQMELMLKQLRIVYVLSQPCPSSRLGPEASRGEIVHLKATEQKWVSDDFMCRRTILNALSDDLFNLYSKKTMTARELWEDLKLMYLYEKFGSNRTLVKKYIEFEMLEGKPILEQVQEINDIADAIVASGMTVEEKFHVSVIISKLPPSWKDVFVRLMREEHLPFARLMEVLRGEEESRIRENRGVPFNLVGDIAGKSLPRKRDMNPLSMQWRRPELEPRSRFICQVCGKNGHLAQYCRFRNRKDDKEAGDKRHDENGSVPTSVEMNMSEGAVE